MDSLYAIVAPVLESMPESHLKRELLVAFAAHPQAFARIETGFRTMTARRCEPAALRRFFASWAQTNNSAMTVAGIGNRLTLLLHRGDPVADETALLRALTSLDRIIDEDLAVVGHVLHAQLFYEMATAFVGDDAWLSHQWIDETASAFKAWKDRASLRDADPMIALLTTLVHEIYTHGEVEFILPLFERAVLQYGMTPSEARRALAWIRVHCGPTEKNHFFHALHAVGHAATALDRDLSSYELGPIVAAYVEKKAAVIDAVCALGVAEAVAAR